MTDKEANVKIYNLNGLLIFEGKYSEANLQSDMDVVVKNDKRSKYLVK